MSIALALSVASSALGIASAAKQQSAADKAAKAAEEAGRLNAQQHVTEMFLAQAQGYRLSEKRLEDHKQAEAQNYAYFASIGRFDQAAEAYLAHQKKIADKDVETIERQLEVTKKNLETTASVAWKYGSNEAAAIRATSSANLISNISSIAQNFPITAFQNQSNTVYSQKFGTSLPKPQLRS